MRRADMALPPEWADDLQEDKSRDLGPKGDAMDQMQLSSSVVSARETSQPELDRAVDDLRAGAVRFSRTSPSAKAALVRECLALVRGADAGLVQARPGGQAAAAEQRRGVVRRLRCRWSVSCAG